MGIFHLKKNYDFLTYFWKRLTEIQKQKLKQNEKKN